MPNTGGKFETLRALSASLPVPALTALDDADFAALWINFDAMCLRVERVLTAINLTASAFLDEHFQELQAEAQPRWAVDADAKLLAVLQRVELDPAGLLAVRSSGAMEDSSAQSYAGLFVTRLGVTGLPALRDAIEAVWSSQFSRGVLMQLLRQGPLRSAAGMRVILQRMVSAEWAGVAFSHDPLTGAESCVVEAVAGVGESLVSGETRGQRARFEAGRLVGKGPDGALHGVVHQVSALVDRVSACFEGRPVDVEWAHDGSQLWLLQARPITTVHTECASATPVFDATPLYGDEAIGAFKPLPDFAQYFRGKRKPLADFAAASGVPGAASMLVRANKAALGVPAHAAALLTAFEQEQVVLDLSARVRQLVLQRNQLLPRLEELLDAHAVTFVVRDFVRGRVGLITQALPSASTDAACDAEVLCEWSVEGLLAINRGTASTSVFVVDAQGQTRGHGAAADGLPSLGLSQLNTLHAVTLAAQPVFGRVQLEWVLDKERLYLIDYSLLDGLVVPPSGDSQRIISVGFAQGMPLIIDATRSLEQLSIAASVSLTDVPTPQALGLEVESLYERIQMQREPVIIVSPRPYAALAPLVRYAAGFVFEQASTLCHLAIILREQGVPAMESEQLYAQALSSRAERVTLDCSA